MTNFDRFHRKAMGVRIWLGASIMYQIIESTNNVSGELSPMKL